jgi:hypothetical protein
MPERYEEGETKRKVVPGRKRETMKLINIKERQK